MKKGGEDNVIEWVKEVFDDPRLHGEQIANKTKSGLALARLLSWLVYCPVHQKVVSSIPVRGACERQPVDVSLFLKNQ